MKRRGRCRAWVAPGYVVGAIVSALLVSTWLLGTHCSREVSPDPGQGGIDLGWIPPPEGLDLSSTDSLAVRVWVLDGRGGVLAGPVRSSLLPGEGPIDLSLVVPAGKDRIARMQLEGLDALGWGSLYAGETGRVDIPAGGRADVVVQLQSTIPVFGEIVVEPGEPGFDLFWRSVQDAVEYELRELGPSGIRTWRTPDTLATIGLRASGAFRDLKGRPLEPELTPSAPPVKRPLRHHTPSHAQFTGSDSTFYRVRAHLPLGGASLYGDSFGIYLPALIDLPRVEAVFPAEGAAGIPDSSDIVLTFDRPMNPATLSDTTVTLAPAAGGNGVDLRPEWRDGDVSLHLAPEQPMQRGVEYAVRVRTDLRDADGRPLDQAPDEPGLQGFESRFTTELYNPLRVIAVDPPDRTANVDIFPEILISLNRAARESTVNPGTVLLADSAGVEVDCDVALLSDSTTIRIQPQRSLAFGRGYVVTVSPGVRDMRGDEGEPLDQDPGTPEHEPFHSGFRTEAYDPIHVISVDPGNRATGVDIMPEILVNLSRAARESTVNSGTVLLADSADVQVDCDVVLLPDSATILVQPVTALAFGRGYLLTVSSGVRDMRGPEGEPLDQNPATPEYEPFNSGFRTLDQPVGPRVISVFPEDGERNHKVSDQIRVTFSRPVQAATVLGGSFTVRRQPTNVAIAGSISWNGERTEFAFQPISQGAPVRLARGVYYRVVVDPGGYDGQGEPFGILDDAGAPLDQDPDEPGFQGFSSMFRVEDNPTVQSVEPANGSNGVPVDTEIVILFTRPMDRTSITPASLSLVTDENDTPVPLEPFEFSSDTTRVTMRPTMPLSFLRTFRVRADTTLLSNRGSRFDDDLLREGYQAFTSRFTTDRETLAPRVESVSPDSGAVGVLHDTTVRVWFSRRIRPDTVNEETFTLTRLHQNPDSVHQVAGQREVSLDSLSAQLVPSDSLRPSTRYEVLVNRFVRDLYGNYLDQDTTTAGRTDFVSCFTTDRDRIPPQVVAVSPPDGADGVPETTVVEVWFSEAMDASTLPGAIRLLLGDDPVEANLEVSAGEDHAILTPDAPLQPLHTYEVRVDSTATDLAGNPLDQDPDAPGNQPFRATFRTRPESIPPRVIDAAYPDEVEYKGGLRRPVDLIVAATIDEPVEPGSLLPGVVRLFDLVLGDEVQMEIFGLEADSIVWARSEGLLRYDRSYQLRIEGLTDLAGNPLDQDRSTPELEPFLDTLQTVPDPTPPDPEGMISDPDAGAGVP